MFGFIKVLFARQRQTIAGDHNTAMVAGRDINIQYGVPGMCL